MCDVTVVAALATSRLSQGSLCNPVTTVEARKIEKYCELLDNWYNFQPVVAMEVHVLQARAVNISLGVSVNFYVASPTGNELAAFRSNVLNGYSYRPFSGRCVWRSIFLALEPEADAFLGPIYGETCDTFGVEYPDTLGDFVQHSSLGLPKDLLWLIIPIERRRRLQTLA